MMANEKPKELVSGGHAPLAGGNLTVADQQSRFRAEASDHSNLKEILVKDLSISIGNRELLSHAELHLHPGRHYVLAGRNGIGKSTLLYAIATDQVPSIPRSVRVLLLGQTETSPARDLRDLSLSDHTVLQHVVRSDERRERLLYEAQTLSAALEHSTEASAAVKAYHKVAHERLEASVSEARLIATRRSGARGKKAREQLNSLEDELKTSQDRLDKPARELDAVQIANDSQNAAAMLSEIQTTLELTGASAVEAKARVVLLGLGFTQDSIDASFQRLSGGWKTRCSLASALCQSSDLLLLDEPTNFLDLPSIMWLERYIADLNTATTVVIVTHDRAFADSVAEELLVFRNQFLERFRGNLSAYELDRYKTFKHMSRMKDAQGKQKKHMEKTVANSINAAKRTGDDKKLKQAASRKKKLDERTGLEVSAKGTRFKLNRDLVGYHLSNRDAIDVPTFDPPIQLIIPTTPADLRFPGPLVSMEKVRFVYKGAKVATLRDVDLTIHLGERVGVVGLNGAGKSTLVSILTSSLTPTSGTVTRHTRAKIGLYSQQSAEELITIAVEQPQLTALTHLMKFAGPDMQEKDARALLSGLGLQGRVASDVPLALLSGGQKVRVAMAKLLHNPPHLLILDEVTTHLDADTVEALVSALRNYQGAILVVSHDRFFMRCVVERESPRSMAKKYRNDDVDEAGDDESSGDDDESRSPGTVYRLAKGMLTKLEGGMEQYTNIALKSSTKLGKT